ncbi:MAG: hypothetical protein ACRDTA_01350 [Pseudonocardiaceae bacterium]
MTALFELGAPYGPAGFRTQAGLRGRTLLAADHARLDRSGARLVLDASYQLERLEHRHVL